MKNIIHISAECYPAAKAGGLADVVGALPKYLNNSGMNASVIMPFYRTDWLNNSEKEFIYEGSAPGNGEYFKFTVHRVKKPDIGADLYLVDIPGRTDRPGVYLDPWTGHPYWDEMERFFSFQIAALEWVSTHKKLPDLIHCHDHHTALVPFMMKRCFRFEAFQEIPSVLTIHNGEYQGKYSMENYGFLPAFNLEHLGLLDWDGALNSLAAGIKEAWRVTTVSEGYMDELLENCHGLELLLRHEKDKTLGIVNGIDSDIWNPATDTYLDHNYSKKTVTSGKKKNKKEICELFDLNSERPLISFIGRLAGEKGADLIPDLVNRCYENIPDMSFAVLGTGDPAIQLYFTELNKKLPGYFHAKLEYNEALAHKIYAGSDFIFMPSRVEPCGLNQLYAMRYGTVPVVRKTGGLADTVKDISEKNGYGFTFDEFSVEDAAEVIERSVAFYQKKELFKKNRGILMELDFSWEKSAKKYKELYSSLEPKKPVK